MERRTKDCPWCGGELRHDTMDKIVPGAMADGSDFRKADVPVIACGTCEFIGERVGNYFLKDESDGREIFVYVETA